MRSAAALITALLCPLAPLAVGSAQAARIPVSTCGETVGGSAFLTNDIDCTGVSAPGVSLQPNAKLDLNGFSLTGGLGDGVACVDRCKINAGEEGSAISGFAGHGVVATRGASATVRVVVNKVDLTGNAGSGAFIDADGESSLRVRRSNVAGNGIDGVSALSRVKVAASTVSGNSGVGVAGGVVQVRDSLVEFNGTGITGTEFMKIDTCDIVDNIGDGILADVAFKSQRMNLLRNGGTGLLVDTVGGPAKVFFSEVSDNGADGVVVNGPQIDPIRFKFAFIRRNGGSGVVARDFRLGFSRVDENAFHGAIALPGGECKARFDRFSLVDNGTDPSCGVSVTCADVSSCATPINLTANTVCGTSYDSSSGFPGTSLNVCADD